MSHVLILSGKNPRVPVVLTAIFVAAVALAAGSALRGSIADLFAVSETKEYPGAVNHENIAKGLFGCELEEVTYHSYHTADPIARVAAFYQQRGYTVIRDDSIMTCCISKLSYVLSGRQKGSPVYVTLEKPWFDEEKHYMADTLIVVASAHRQGAGALTK